MVPFLSFGKSGRHFAVDSANVNLRGEKYYRSLSFIW